MNSRLSHLENGNLEIHITLSWSEVQTALVKAKDAAVKNSNTPGFRKGMAPVSLVEGKLNSDKLYSQALQTLLPQAYSQAVTDHALKPILYPKLSLTSAQPESDWEILALTCEAPSVSLNITQLNLSTSKEKLSPDEKLSRILAAARQAAAIKVPDLLVMEEADHRLAHLVENLTRLGMTLDQYLSTKKLTSEQLKAQTSSLARIDLETEFILESLRQNHRLPDRKSTLDFLISQV